ncbi:MAG: dihydrofolate reductase [Planctomycetales bacterium]|nr:dihydrofolate reductase [Planctomycetales bacterium]
MQEKEIDTPPDKPIPGSWTLVVAMARNGVIGRGGSLPWKLRSDLQRFKRMTMGHCLLMGRKTYESIGRPLPGRQTLVLTRQRAWMPGEVESSQGGGRPSPGTVLRSVGELAEVDGRVEPGRAVMVVGGAEVYRAALDRCATLWVTRVEADVTGDTYFPPIDWSRWKLDSQEAVAAGPDDELPSVFQIWRRGEPAGGSAPR